MWNLALQSKNWLVLVVLIMISPSGRTSDVLFEDRVLYRLQGRTIFLEDIKEYLKPVESYRCLFPNSVMFALSGLNEQDLERLSELRGNQSMAADRASLLSMMRHLKLQFYANNEGVSVASGFERSLPRSECGIEGSFESWDRELRSLVQAELFFQKNTPETSVERLRYVQKVVGEIESEILF